MKNKLYEPHHGVVRRSIGSLTLPVALALVLFYVQGENALAAEIHLEKSGAIDSVAPQQPSPDAPRTKILKNKMLFPHGKVLVVLPKGLRAFGVEDFDRHYGNATKPEYAFIDDSTDSRISVSATTTKLQLNELEKYKTRLEAAFTNAVKDIIWHKREILQFGEVEWIHLEMQNTATDGSTVMNDFYVTSMGGHPLMFTITTNTKHWYEMRKVMQKMMLSVTVHATAATSDK